MQRLKGHRGIGVGGACTAAAKTAVAVGAVLLTAATSHAGSVHVWPEAVAVGDDVRLGDVCELRGFPEEERSRLVDEVITAAPAPGRTSILPLESVRSALAARGVNMASVVVGGASQCRISRPAERSTPRKEPESNHGARGEPASAGHLAGGDAGESQTLRNAVRMYFESELGRYPGEVDLVFDRGSEGVLDLSGPQFHFVVRRRGGSPLGLTPIEVDVLAEGRVVQSVPLVVHVSMRRPVLAAKRAVNQGATLDATYLSLTEVVVERLDNAWLVDSNAVIGQRARRFLPAGSLIEPDMLEPVPLVRRGELVTVESVAGGITVVTSGRVDSDGLLGEAVRVRAADNRRVEYDAWVSGPGRVRVGGQIRETAARLARWEGEP